MNKYIKILVIFFVGIILSISIYYFLYEETNNILSIGDDLSLGKTPFNNYRESYNDFYKRSNNINYNDSLSYTDLSYEELYNKIYYDETVYNKGKYINIKNVIRNSNLIIISANNNITYNKCNKNNRIFIEYLEHTFAIITKIIDQIDKIGESKIIILTPYCNKYDKKIDNYIEKYFNYKGVTFINLYNKMHIKSYYLPNPNSIYPSLEGYNMIYNEIINSFQKSNT